jgi:hypothetical protein
MQNHGFLPVCSRHKASKIYAGHCKHNDGFSRCNKLIKYSPPFAELCDDHRDWDGLPCYLLALPTELRMHIFSYLLPDKPINAWLDSPLRKDKTRITWELLLVNRQINSEAMDILYGSQPFTMGLNRENVALCGGIYCHDRSEWPSIMVYNPPRENRVGHIPPMLKHIRHLRLQITFVNPGFPTGRPHHYPIWDEAIDLFDLRDSAGALVHLLSGQHSLISLSVVLIAQNIIAKSWPADDLCRILHTVSEPLMQLRNIPKAKLEGVYQIHSPHRLSLTQYFPDNMRSLTSDDPADEGFHTLSYRYSGHKDPTFIRVTAPLVNHCEFEDLKRRFEDAVMSQSEPELHLETPLAIERFDAFRSAYHAVEANFRTVLPRGKNWMLHKARVAREGHDIEAIGEVRQELEKEIKRLVRNEREAIDAKEKAAFAALEAFDEKVQSKKVRHGLEDGDVREDDSGDEPDSEDGSGHDDGDDDDDMDDADLEPSSFGYVVS